MAKIFNTKGIVALIVVLAILHFGIALFVSPILAGTVIKALNKVSDTKISVDKVNVWPLTMTLTTRGIKVFDPDNENKRIVFVERSAARLSVLGLLSKKIVFSDISLYGAEIDLEGESDGTFNLQKIAPGGRKRDTTAEGKKSLLDRLKGKQDWFSRVYKIIKDSASKKAAERKKEERKESLKVKKEVKTLPKGRIVKFTRSSDGYFLQIRNFSVKNSTINIVSPETDKISVTGAGIQLKDLALDPHKGARFSSLAVSGNLNNNGVRAGELKLFYNQQFKKDSLITNLDISARNVDLPTAKFIYQDSLPVNFVEGSISISSKTRIIDGALDSTNNFAMQNLNMTPKSGAIGGVSLLPLPVICDAVNKINPLKIDFNISGTVEKPRLEGFDKALMEIVKPYVGDMIQDVKNKGMKALDDMFKKVTGGKTE